MRRRRRRKGAIEKKIWRNAAPQAPHERKRRGTRSRRHCVLSILVTFSSGVTNPNQAKRWLEPPYSQTAPAGTPCGGLSFRERRAVARVTARAIYPADEVEDEPRSAAAGAESRGETVFPHHIIAAALVWCCSLPKVRWVGGK
eukprot:gene22288-biopygen8747